jgi:CP family cyanate transporter-like MFS transporter
MRHRPGPATSQGLLLAAVLLVSVNLRGAIAAVSPVLPQIREDLHLSAGAAGLLTTLPVLCFAAAAPVGAWLGRRTGMERAITLGCLAIAAGTAVRSVGGVAVLMTGTLVIGLAMTLGNVLLPVVVKRDFGPRAGTVTGLYTAALCGGAALTAALTAPLAALTGWRAALALWALLALAGTALWHAATRGERHLPSAAPSSAARSVWRQPLAWAVTLLLGMQSLAYYTVTAWLPTLLVEDVGVPSGPAGVGMSLFQVLGIPGTLVIPLLARRSRRQGWLGLCVAGSWALMVVGLLVAPSAWLVWSVVGGVAQGAGISLAFTVLVLRASDAAAARSLSSMTQLVGYSLGASGPVLAGWLYGATGGWTAPLLLLVGVCTVMAAASVVAGRDRTVGG